MGGGVKIFSSTLLQNPVDSWLDFNPTNSQQDFGEEYLPRPAACKYNIINIIIYYNDKTSNIQMSYWDTRKPS